MKRTVVFIPKEEILEQFRKNARQDVKVVTPAMMTQTLAARLRARGKDVKEEVPLGDCHWTHSPAEEPNKICESADFADESIRNTGVGPVAVSFADLGSVETFHYHREHWEVYFSEHRLGVEYKPHEKPEIRKEVLNEGGAIVFAPGIAHRMEIHGLTIVLELPAVPRDREASGPGDTR